MLLGLRIISVEARVVPQLQGRKYNINESKESNGPNFSSAKQGKISGALPDKGGPHQEQHKVQRHSLRQHHEFEILVVRANILEHKDGDEYAKRHVR